MAISKVFGCKLPRLITSIMVASFFRFGSRFHVAVICSVKLHECRCSHIAVIQLWVRMVPVNLCTLSQTVNAPVPSLVPIHTIIQGGTYVVAYQHYAPPIPAQARATHVMRPYSKCATQQNRTILQCAYVRHQTASFITQQHHTILQCAYVRTPSDSHTPTPHYGSARARTPSVSLV
jgi:hypothetical protein